MSGDNIRVNSVHPGYVATPMTKKLQNAKEFKEMAIGITPMGREAVPDEIAFGVLYLACSKGAFCNEYREAGKASFQGF